MRKAVMISIQPHWCELISNGEKTVEIRKTKPKMETPFKCYIYCTQGTGKNTLTVPVSAEQVRRHYEETGSMVCLNCPIGNGKVIGEFVCDELIPIRVFKNGSIQNWMRYDLARARIPYDDMARYIGHDEVGYGWHISNLVIYDEPKELSEFKPWTRECKYSDLGFAIPKCSECHDCKIDRPPQSWCYVEELPKGDIAHAIT